jgi:hypothetical protein
MRSALAASLARWKQHSPLARDVTLVLLVKAAALGVLWWAFFSTPVAPGMNVPSERVAERLLSPPPVPANADR